MAKASAFAARYPGVFFLDRDNPPAIAEYMRKLGWLGAEEVVIGAEPAGEGNMNCTLRVRTTDRSLILKQSRPWVEKYPHIPAPCDRAIAEGRFYMLASSLPALARRMPKLLGSDEEARLLCLEDLGPSRDYTSLYAGRSMTSTETGTLLQFLSALHAGFGGGQPATDFTNQEMRKLNHRHIFVIPLERENGLDLNAITPGLDAAAQPLKSDTEYNQQVRDLGDLYLRVPGDCLLHGDFFPGSWLSTPQGVKVIDPEFCLVGPAEFDLGVMLAHFCLAQGERVPNNVVLEGYGGKVEEALVVRFAGVEIMRRLIGVAQLPLKLGLQSKAKLLKHSRDMVENAA